jgi:integrase
VSARTRSWENAERLARAKEKELVQLQTEGKPIIGPTTVADAVAKYLADKRQQGLVDDTISKLENIFEKQFLGWCTSVNVAYLRDLDLERLREWRETWKGGALTRKKLQERVQGFFWFCLRSGWISSHPAKGLSKIKVEDPPTDYFPKEEFAKIVDSTYLYDSKTVDAKEMVNNATRLRTLALLMRWSGLAIRDAVTLERNRLDDQDQIFLYRAKTGEPVLVKIPREVAQALRNIPPGPKPNPRYFFWSGNGKPKSAVADWQRAFRKLFRIADIKHADGKKKRCFPHMFRDTFAVELLLAGVPLDQVSIYLGHKSIKTTEKHYAPFVKARRINMGEMMERAWAQMGVINSLASTPVQRKAPHRSA